MEPSRPDHTRARAAAALLLSLALHLALAWWFARAPPGGRVVASPLPAGPPLEVQIVQLPPAPVAPPPAPAPRPRPAPAPRKPEPTKAAETPGSSEDRPESSASASAGGSPEATPPGAPRQIDLTPNLGPPGEGAAGIGRTITNHPETAEEHGIAIAQEGARVKGRVDGFIKGIKADLGARRVQMGLVDPYFSGVRGALQAAVEKNAPDGMPGKNVGQQLLDAVLGGASNYGSTGNPYGEGQVPNASPAEREFTGHAEDMARRYSGSSLNPSPQPGGAGGKGGGSPQPGLQGLTTEQLQQCAVQGKQLDDFLAGKFGKGLFTVVSLRQAPDGKVLEVKLESPSGMPAYDDYVLKVAPTALEKLPPPPDHGFGINPGAELKSVWRFEGRVKFKRPLKEWNAVTGVLTTGVVSALYGLACPGLGPPVTFDPVTGEVELIDLAHPKFTCQVKLLRLE